ncbi:MAG: ABC transporter ATP-binding protein [Desulfurococcales archaeon]|nr:ABC transporter ATP-binding protein [Desulfurococcales archaeon]
MTGGNVLLRVEDVVKTFGGIRALDGVSIEIYEGELLSIIGPNGSGKTTLFNVINGVLKPDKGRILLDGRDITPLPPYKRAELGIARTFQIPKPWPHLTVRENVAIGALFGRERSKIDVKTALELADRILETVGLSEKAEEEAGKLTVPEKKLLELARAIAMKPRLLLLDEVVAGMNPKDADMVVEVVKRARDEYGITVVSMVEHVMRIVAKFAERVVVMNQGRVLLEGPPGEVLRHPQVIEVYLGGPI